MSDKNNISTDFKIAKKNIDNKFMSHLLIFLSFIRLLRASTFKYVIFTTYSLYENRNENALSNINCQNAQIQHY